MTKHIIWDWNGTLFHDIDAVVAATNEVFRPYGLRALSVEDFRNAYERPIWRAYEKLIGRPLEEGEWERLDGVYHDHYHRFMESCDLAADARDALSMWDGSQSLLSMWIHDRLVPTISGFGLDGHFTRVDGLRDAVPGGSKAAYMARHIESLVADPADVVAIGDSADDALAAVQVGASAVLYAGGMQARASLEAVGVPVTDTLLEALAYARNGGR